MSNPEIPKNWEDLINLKDFLPTAPAKFVRFSEDLEFYRLYQNIVPSDIRLKLLNQQIGSKDVSLIKNQFPYSKLLHFLPNVKHFCLWSRQKKLSPEVVEQEIKNNFPKNNFFWFENSDKIKSILEIWHCQVFIKLK